jgi:DNA-binding response OmpR family regulator
VARLKEGGLNVLIAEGNVRLGEVLSQTLDAAGHYSTVVFNWQDAVLAQRAKSYEAYIIDLEFPDCGGIAMLGSLRREASAGPAARAIGWTTFGHFWRGLPITSMFDAIVEKPASMKTLLAALQGPARSSSNDSIASGSSAKGCEWWPQSGWRLD